MNFKEMIFYKLKNEISILFKTEFLLYFWVPRIILSLILFFNYEKLHISSELLRPETINISPDLNVYMNSNEFNPLFAITLKFLNRIDPILIIRIILGEIISSWGILNLYNTLTCFKKLSRLPLLIMGAHPFLVIYGMRFTTENFSILCVSLFIISRLNEINNRKLINNFKYRFIQLKSQFVLLFFRSQNIPIFFIELILFSRDFLGKHSKFSKSFTKNYFFLINFIGSIFIFFIIFVTNKNYILSSFSTFWDSNYPVKPNDIYINICNLTSCENFFSIIFIKIISIVFFIPIGLIFLTGARGRFTDFPWQIDLFGISINNIKSMNPVSIEILSNLNQEEFILKVIIPLIIFSIFHIVGIYKWIKHTNFLSHQISFFPLTICLYPLLIFPYLRYFIPLIPLAAIGYGFKNNLRNK